MDISKITSLKFTNAITPAVVYLTDYANAKLNDRGRYGRYIDGDLKREYSATGKFGTVCVPYKASYAGAEIYEIVGKSASSISLAKVTGLLEAGKPYFYMSSDENGQNNEGLVRNVNFFRADLDTYDAATAGTNNGLVGTFSEITAPTGADYYILSGNKLYNVNSSVTVGANKAYVDASQISDGGGSSRVFLDFNEPTGVNEVKAQKEFVSGDFFNLAGQRVAQPTKGLYIMNGKKVVIK